MEVDVTIIIKYYSSHFVDKETEEQVNQATCPRFSAKKVEDRELEPRKLCLRTAHILCHQTWRYFNYFQFPAFGVKALFSTLWGRKGAREGQFWKASVESESLSCQLYSRWPWEHCLTPQEPQSCSLWSGGNGGPSHRWLEGCTYMPSTGRALVSAFHLFPAVVEEEKLTASNHGDQGAYPMAHCPSSHPARSGELMGTHYVLRILHTWSWASSTNAYPVRAPQCT